MRLEDLTVKLFVDGACICDMHRLGALPHVRGFTTNPTLMRQAGVQDYELFAREALALVPDKPISFEVFADDLPTMRRQAERIASWSDNVYVKIPITTTDGVPALELIHTLSQDGVKVNVTAVFTPKQMDWAGRALAYGAPAILSVFAGRIADAGCNPVNAMSEAKFILQGDGLSNVELLWASTREVYNVYQANRVGCDIITVPPDLLAKLPLLGKDLDEFSLETVKMFHRDAQEAGYAL